VQETLDTGSTEATKPVGGITPLSEDLIGKIMLYETEQLLLNDAIALFRELVRIGRIWDMPSRYVSVAALMIRNGDIDMKGSM
jgi:hypothetical protein